MYSNASRVNNGYIYYTINHHLFIHYINLHRTIKSEHRLSADVVASPPNRNAVNKFLAAKNSYE